MGESYKLTITGLSPIYIGSGEVYSQLDYIAEDNKIYILDFDKVLSQIPFETLDDLTNDIQENFLNNRWTGEVREFLAKYDIDWKESVEKSYDLIGKIGKNELNQFIKTGENLYIPGSSIKGAIRTAILFHILNTHPQERNRIEQNLLSNFNDREIQNLVKSDGKTDLFRALIISDSIPTEEHIPIKIVETNVYHLRNKELTIPIFNEVLYKGFSSEGSIKVDRKLIDSGSLISRYFDLQKEALINALNSFSQQIIKFELNTFKNLKDPNLSGIIKFYEDLETQIINLNENECIMRLGQGSSVLGITLFLNFQDNNQIVNRFKNLEIIRFDMQDRKNPGYAIARQGRIMVLVDRGSRNRPRRNETWLCSVVSRRRDQKYVKLLEKRTTLEGQKELLYPLTRKFMLSNDEEILYPFGWVKMRFA